MEALLQQSGITYHSPSGEQFSSLQASYTGIHPEAPPSLIALPETSAQVATIVRHALATSTDIVVRGGGHDIFGRFAVKGAVSIDLRKLNSVAVPDDKKTARIGGGATHSHVLGELARHDLQVPSGGCGTVGYTGWCLAGGFGPYSSSYGLGADQIVGARVVNADGELVDADDRLLKGLRGGGGSLAIVTELVVKAYPLTEVQAGMIAYDPTDLPKTVSTFLTNLAALNAEHPQPRQLYFNPLVAHLGPLGTTLACTVVWNGPSTPELTTWIDRIGALAPRMPGLPEPQASVNKTTAKGFIDYITSMLPATVAGRCHAVSITKYSPQVVDVLASQVAKITAGMVGGFNVHTVHSTSPSTSSSVPESVLPHRKPEIMFEILGFGADEASAAPCVEWATELRNRLAETDAALKASYIALTAPEFVDLDKIYGKENLAELRAIKREYDPKGVFKHTVPRLV